jgi:hypothetical protein
MSETTGQKPINPQTGRPFYYKDNPEAVKKRDDSRMYLDGKHVSKKHPLYKPGKYKSFEDAAFSSLGTYSTKSEGYIYIISNPAWKGWYKVGKAVDAEDRCNSYNTSSPFRDYVLEEKIKVEDRNKAEKLAHTQAIKKAKIYSGEWFNISLKDMIDIIHSIPSIEKDVEEKKNDQLTLNF